MKRLLLVLAGRLLQPLSAVSLTLSSEYVKNLRGAQRRIIDVYATVGLLDALKLRAAECQQTFNSNHASEKKRLDTARVAAAQAQDRAVLAATLEQLKQSWPTTGGACTQLLTQYHTIKAMLGASGAPSPDCSTLLCGMDASCQVAPGGSGASCKCNRCFDGDGFTCTPGTCAPAQYTAGRPLLGTPLKEDKRLAKDVSVVVFGDNLVAAAIQLKGSNQRGYLRLGRVGEHGVVWGEPQAFSGEGAAFGAVVTAHGNGRIAVAFRDKDIGGDGYLVGGQIQAGNPLRADLQDPHLFAHDQAQRMVLVPLASSRAVCLYAGHIPKTPATNAAQSFGGAILVHLAGGGAVSVLGKYRFAHDLHVSRLTATRLSPTSLVVAYRALPLGLGGGNQPPSQELSAAWIGMEDGELAIATNPLALEPTRREMWGRAVSLVSQNLISYTYQSGTEKLTKMAILRVDNESHGLELVGTPRTIGQGDAQFVQSISLDPGMLMPHSFTYFQHPGERSSAEVCRISAQGAMERCGKAAWADSELKAASGAKLADGRLFFTYVDTAGAPFYQIFGAQEFLQE
jgi:hypothetical protein